MVTPLSRGTDGHAVSGLAAPGREAVTPDMALASKMGSVNPRNSFPLKTSDLLTFLQKLVRLLFMLL
jgi:hypothetical protein